MGSPLRSLSDINTVSNVCLFISDSLRFDHLPKRIKKSGVTLASVASASHTAASIPSIITGNYPSTHGCWQFDDQLPTLPPLLDRPHCYDAKTIWTHLRNEEKPPVRITRAKTEPTLPELAEGDDGFVYVEHDKGGHSPYGYSFDEHSTPSFYKSLNDPGIIPDLYERSIQASADRFYELKKRLSDLGVLNDTLLVFASDHGELLGEPARGGLYGHGRPVVPEVTRVPLVFMGSGLPEGFEHDSLTAGIDIAPTILSALGEPVPSVDGCDIWTDTPPPNRTPRSEFWQVTEVQGRSLTVYLAISKWSDQGGIVYQHPPRLPRVAYALYSHLYSEAEASIVRNQAPLSSVANIVKLYFPSVIRFGDASGLDLTSLKEIDGPTSQNSPGREGYYNDEQLRYLGYIE